jgi:hypothetical protein
MVKAWFVNGQALELDGVVGPTKIESYHEIIEVLAFKTEAELDAFKTGLEKAVRYDDCEMGVYDTAEDALRAAAKFWEEQRV